MFGVRDPSEVDVDMVGREPVSKVFDVNIGKRWRAILSLCSRGLDRRRTKGGDGGLGECD